MDGGLFSTTTLRSLTKIRPKFEEKYMNIVFLDIDGVLNNQQEDTNYYEGYTGKHLYSPSRVKILNKFLSEVDAKVVVTSVWRLGETLESMQMILADIGCTAEVIGMTPHLSNGYVFRGNEIYKWIKDNAGLLGVKYYYDFKSYVIFDDDSDMLYWQKDNFVHVDGEIGLSTRNCMKAMEILSHYTKKQFNGEFQ